ncbi:MAG: hormogonium polysaccharide biosynthesis protein HpsA, partial [Pseudanabaenaceae cyanobacterium]
MSSREQSRVRKFYLSLLSDLRKWLVKIGSPFRISRKFIRNLMRRGATQAGFILPTVVFVTLATTLLVLGVVARSADRAQTAANARVEQVFEVANSAVIDRARSKLELLLNDDTLPRTTPPEGILQQVISSGKYTYPDETRLQIVEDFATTDTATDSLITTSANGSPDGKIRVTDSDLIDQEFHKNVWKFPIDTDGNGKFDSYGIYSIIFRTRPPELADGKPNPNDRRVTTLEAPTLPFDETGLSGRCQGVVGVTVATNEGWTQRGNKLKKAFFVHAVTVPITDPDTFPPDAGDRFETFRGIPSISALELQQDRARTPTNNTAAWFEGDMEVARPARFRFNGRIYAGGNLMIGAINNDNPIQFYQVSSSGTSPASENTLGSCYYERNNAEINVAGNVVEGDALTTDTALEGAVVDLWQGQGVQLQSNLTPAGDPDQPPLNDLNRTVQNTGAEATLNEFEYNRRVNVLVNEALRRATLTGIDRSTGDIQLTYSSGVKDPPSVQSDLIKRIRDEGIFGTGPLLTKARRESLEVYFKARVRKVPYKEVPFGSTPSDPTPLLTPVPIPASEGGGEDLAPPLQWAIPTYLNPGVLKTNSAGTSATDYDGNGVLQAPTANALTLTPPTGSTMVLPSLAPETRAANQDIEKFIGDRVRVGNGLPALYIKNQGGSVGFVGTTNQSIVSNNNSIKFNDPSNPPTRYRVTRSFVLENLGETDRGGFWELSAADDPSNGNSPPNPVPITGGLRVVTNAGIYSPRPEYTFLPRFRTGLPDNTSTPDIDESAAPLWNGQPIDNPITIDEDDPLAPVNDEAAIRATTTANRWALNEATFAAPDPTPNDGFNELNYVVWPDSMPMTGQMRFFPGTYINPRTGATQNVSAPGNEPGWYPFEIDDNGNIIPYAIGANGQKVEAAASTPEDRERARNWRGHLQMRASAIYHYKYDDFDPEKLTASSISADVFQRPVACVSSYYDPTTPETARNAPGLLWNTTDYNGNQRGRSNNGIVYPVPTETAANIAGVPNFDFTTDKFVVTADASKVRDRNVPLVQRLAYQANLVFPNGRFVNEPLRNVLRRIQASPGNSALSARLTLAEQSTLDANICALRILDGTLTPLNQLAPVVNGVTIPQGTFKEAAFLDAREVKALNKNESLLEGVSGYVAADGSRKGLLEVANNRADIYDLEIEQRQPLEVRTTDLDVDRMRGATVTGPINTGVPTEYLLPFSGVVYATREDALPDMSYFDYDSANNRPFPTLTSKRRALSSTDFRLDPTRKVAGIRLINGYRIFRSSLINANLNDVTGNVLGNRPTSTETQLNYNENTKGEKGIILVSNTPVYVRAQRDPFNPNNGRIGFNVHTQEEFRTALAADWSNFYSRIRGDLNPNFACRPGQTSTCNEGDQWRPATVIADAVTILSDQWRDGYRSDGDFDLRNNSNTSTSVNWINTLNTTSEQRKDSIYVVERRKQGFFNNNFVTNANWLAPTNSDNQTGTLSVNYPEGNLASYNGNGVTPVQRRGWFQEYSMDICRKVPVEDCGFDDWEKMGGGTTTLPNFGGTVSAAQPYGNSGTPAGSPRFIAPEDTRFPRRVSFLRYDDIYRDGNMSLVFTQLCDGTMANWQDRQGWPIPIGVVNGNSTSGYTYPLIMGGGFQVPFSGESRVSYGDIPCSQVAVIDIDESQDKLEGRRANVLYTSTPNVPNPLPTPTFNTITEPGGTTVQVATNLGNFLNDDANPLPTAERAFRPFYGRVAVRNIAKAPANIIGARLTFRAPGTNTNPGNFGSNAPEGNGLGTDPVNIAGTDYIQKFYVADSPTGGNRCYISQAAATTGTAASALPQYAEIPNGSTIYFNKNSYAPCRFMVLVTRDNANENPEYVNIRLDNGVPTGVSIGSPGGIEDNESFEIQIDWNWTNDTNEPLPGTGAMTFDPNVCMTPAERPGPVIIRYERTGTILSTTTTNEIRDDRVVTITNRVFQMRPVRKADCSSGTPSALKQPTFGTLKTPTYSMGQNLMPVSALLPTAAVYPSPSATYPNVCNDPSTNQPVDTGGYKCNNLADGRPIFPQLVAPRANALNSILPMLPGMRTSLPSQSDRTLWFRTINNSDTVIGADDNIDYRQGRHLLIYNHSWPFLRGRDDGSYRANLSHGKRLQLPETVCIRTDGLVDERCLDQGRPANTSDPVQGTAAAPSYLANLNLPYNPHFPADQSMPGNNRNTTNTLASRRRGVADNVVQPASSFAVCGITGNSRALQLDEGETSDFTSAGAGEVCPNSVRNVIVDFYNKLMNLTPAPAGTPGHPRIEVERGGKLTDFTDVVKITATNTFANNRVHVIELQNLGTTAGSVVKLRGTLRLSANRDNIGRKRGPSPVFIFRGPRDRDVSMEGLKVQLDGVDPNNIFWVFPRTGRKALTIAGALPKPNITNDPDKTSILVGNFIGNMPNSSTAANESNTSYLNIGLLQNT